MALLNGSFAKLESVVLLKSDDKLNQFTRAQLFNELSYNTFIDACYIQSSFQEPTLEHSLFIASQAPREDELNTFWKIIVQNNVKVIINLREGNAMLEENTSSYIL